MKVHNKEFFRGKFMKTVEMVFKDIAPELVEILNHEIVRVDTKVPSYMVRNNDIVVGGVTVIVQYDTVSYHGSGDKISFGVNTDKEGMLDMQKLADKMRSNLGTIREFIERHETNRKTRDELRSRRIANGEILDRLKEEGLIRYVFEFDERADGFSTEIKLRDEEELRAFIAFKNELIAKREVTA